MPEIQYQFPINAPVEKVFETISSPAGLDNWWCLKTSGKRELNETYHLFFGEPYRWKAIISKLDANKEFELTMIESDSDWNGSKVNFRLSYDGSATTVLFCHQGWPAENEHFSISGFCWAMYLRLLKRLVEFGEIVEYQKRLEV